jgi:hypothetical protein
MSIPIVNDYCAYMVEKKLCAAPLPENTQLIDSVSKAGKLTGNGNGMQYLGAILIQSELTMEQLDSYYLHYRENEWEYLVTVQTDRDLSFIELDHLRFSQEVTADGYYIVYSWGKGIELYEMLGMRGH